MRALSDDQIGRIALRARALSDPTRLRILDVLGRSSQSVGQIAAVLASQPSTVSRHLQVLFMAGLVARRRDASTVVYSIAAAELLEWCRALGMVRLGSEGPGR